MKHLKSVFLFLILGFSVASPAQTTAPEKMIPVAVASLREYKALYVLNESGDKK